jgi:hypothetical protein
VFVNHVVVIVVGDNLSEKQSQYKKHIILAYLSQLTEYFHFYIHFFKNPRDLECARIQGFLHFLLDSCRNHIKFENLLDVSKVGSVPCRICSWISRWTSGSGDFPSIQ